MTLSYWLHMPSIIMTLLYWLLVPSIIIWLVVIWLGLREWVAWSLKRDPPRTVKMEWKEEP